MTEMPIEPQRLSLIHIFLQGNAKTSWLRIIPVGIIYFILYYVIFTFMIRKFNFKTPGHEDDDTETKLYTKADVNARKEAGKTAGAAAATSGDPVSELITRGLGGKKNIGDVYCCATRRRITVAEPENCLLYTSIHAKKR